MAEKIIPKSYGSIPHLSTSKLTQQADKKITMGQELLLTKKVRDFRDFVVVTEKVDGSNMGIYRTNDKNGTIIPIMRSGYHAASSSFRQHQMFCKYVSATWELWDWLPKGWRVCGEWCVQAHGTLMDISNDSPFVVFDIFDSYNHRLPFLEFYGYCMRYTIPMVEILHIGSSISIQNALKLMQDGYYGCPERPEGLVYRMERNRNVEFLAKWVHEFKEDGKYLNRGKEIWNKGAEKYF